MRERPILFSAPMVRALLAGTKTQTRRLVRAPGLSLDPCSHDYACKGEMVTENGRYGAVFWGDRGASKLVPNPFGASGHRLWVRETWRTEEREDMVDGIRFAADHAFVPIANTKEAAEAWVQANSREGEWRLSIFLPRWASRITLEIAAVRVERLQSITEEDAVAEGCLSYDKAGEDPRNQYRELWDPLNGKRGPWASNPWVWVVSFVRVQSCDCPRVYPSSQAARAHTPDCKRDGA